MISYVIYLMLPTRAYDVCQEKSESKNGVRFISDSNRFNSCHSPSLADRRTGIKVHYAAIVTSSDE